ncbi:hypothetical protein [Actinomadura sp. WMMA1423]|uniref:hypothetical protein n=1 Tax=Actinomadura sp. WMMA1423 TaxID=2591108 RepID=UPI00114611DF|nr:hypothetical protein [Actinomadura sp. WMMA1423]
MSVAEPAGNEAPAGASPAASGLQQLLKVVGAVVAPTTLLTALAYYFGWLYAFYYFDYLGVSSTVLNPSVTDYFVNSVDALFAPVTISAAGALLVFWGHAALRVRLAARPHDRLLRIALPAMTGLGVALAGAGLWTVYFPTPLRNHVVAAPSVLAAGVLLLGYAVHLWRSIGARRTEAPAWRLAAEWTLVFAIVGICLFWAAAGYAAEVGRGRAAELVRSLPSMPPVVLYSQRNLGIDAPGVRETRCRAQDAVYRHRYDGLRLVRFSSDQYLLLPVQWSRGRGVAIVLPRSDSVRLEFRPSTARAGIPPVGC